MREELGEPGGALRPAPRLPQGGVLSRGCFRFEVGPDLVQLCLLLWSRGAWVEPRHAPLRRAPRKPGLAGG